MELQKEFLRVVLKSIEISDVKLKAEQLLRSLLNNNTKEKERKELTCNEALTTSIRPDLSSSTKPTQDSGLCNYILEKTRNVSNDIKSYTEKKRELDLANNIAELQDNYILASEINIDESVESCNKTIISKNSKTEINEGSTVISKLQKELIEIMEGNNIFYSLFKNYCTQQENFTALQKRIGDLERQLIQKENDYLNMEQISSQNHNAHKKVITTFEEENLDLNSDLGNKLLQRNLVNSQKKTISDLEAENTNLMEADQKYNSLIHSKDSLICWLQQQLTDANKANIYAVWKLFKVEEELSSEKISDSKVINDLKLELADAKRLASENEITYKSQLQEWKRLCYKKESKCLQQKVKIFELSNIITDLHIQLTCTIDILLRRIQDLNYCKVSLKDSRNNTKRLKLENSTLQFRLSKLSTTSEELNDTVLLSTKFDDSEISAKGIITSTPVKCIVLSPPCLSSQKTFSNSTTHSLFRTSEELTDDVLFPSDNGNKQVPSQTCGVTSVNGTNSTTQNLTIYKEPQKSHLESISEINEELNNILSSTDPHDKQISVENGYITSKAVSLVDFLSPLSDQKIILQSSLQSSSTKSEEPRNKIVSSTNSNVKQVPTQDNSITTLKKLFTEPLHSLSDKKTISRKTKEEVNNISPSYKKYKQVPSQNVLSTSIDSSPQPLCAEKEFVQFFKSKNLTRNKRQNEVPV